MSAVDGVWPVQRGVGDELDGVQSPTRLSERLFARSKTQGRTLVCNVRGAFWGQRHELDQPQIGGDWTPSNLHRPRPVSGKSSSARFSHAFLRGAAERVEVEYIPFFPAAPPLKKGGKNTPLYLLKGNKA